MEDSDSSFSLSSLLCRENEACFDEDTNEDDSYINLINFDPSETEDDYIELLVERERIFQSKIHGSSEDSSLMTENWLRCARLDAIAWVLKTRASFGFRLQTAYLSVTYFDQFLSKRAIDSNKAWAIQLLSVACLSLAAKMEECRVPALSEYQVEDYNFECKLIQRMELLVLNTLEWRMDLITPFAYLNYFINKFCDKAAQSKDLVSRTVKLILAITQEMKLMDHRPSVIAAAAVLAASDRRLTRNTVDFKMSVISLSGSFENAHIYSCYNTMQELEMGKFKIPKFVSSPDLSTIEDSSFTSAAVGSKRRRLTFNDSDQNCGISTDK